MDAERIVLLHLLQGLERTIPAIHFVRGHAKPFSYLAAVEAPFVLQDGDQFRALIAAPLLDSRHMSDTHQRLKEGWVVWGGVDDHDRYCLYSFHYLLCHWRSGVVVIFD